MWYIIGLIVIVIVVLLIIFSKKKGVKPEGGESITPEKPEEPSEPEEPLGTDENLMQ